MEIQKFSHLQLQQLSPSSRKVPLRTVHVQAIPLRLGKCLNTCSCSTDLATNSLRSTWCGISLLSPSSSKSIKNYRQSRKLLCICFLKNSSKIRSNCHFRLGKIRLPGTPIRIPEASHLNPSKHAHPSRPFCIGDRMRLANVSENLHLPFWRKLRHG